MTDSKTADRKNELESALAGKVASNKEIADSFEVDESGTVQIEVDQKAAFDANMKDIREIRSLLADFVEQEKADEYLNQPEGESAGFSYSQKSDPRSLGEMFLDSPEFKELQNGRNGANMRTPFELKRANLGQMWRQKDVYTDLPSGTPGSFGTIQRDSIVDSSKRQTRVRDLFPVQTTTASVIEYFRVTGYTEGTTNNASPVPERGTGVYHLKPQTELAFTGQQAPVRTIAHWEAAHRNVLADEPALSGIIDNELLYGLRLEEDNQILNGSGTGENLTGILNTSGVQTYSWSSGPSGVTGNGDGDNKADALRRAATLAFLSYYQPTGVILHPNDWEDIELVKNGQGDYLMAVSIAVGGEPRVWRMPVVDTPAISEGTALVGAFGIGAQLYDREQANVRIAEQHSDFFVRNAVVVLAEQRLALATKRPEAFVDVTFDGQPG